MTAIKIDRSKDKIAIIAPSGTVLNATDSLSAGIKILETHGFACIYEEGILSGWGGVRGSNNVPSFSAEQDVRKNSFVKAVQNEDVKIIWAFRGGYGVTEFLFECMDVIPSGNKILIGYSDITPLHYLLNKSWNMPTIHGPNLVSILPSSPQHKMLLNILSLLEGGAVEINLKPININNRDLITGKVMGGNLTLMVNLIGTRLHPNLAGSILLLEDVNEEDYKVHRYLVHMKNAGLFDEIAAIIFADFTGKAGQVDNAIEDFCHRHIPQVLTYRTSNIGHGIVNYPVILGNEGTIAQGKLFINSPFTLL